jgi:Ca2+-binding EF-hand superfamily protein
MLRTLTAAILLSLLSAPSMAQMRAGGEGMFEKADVNHDGSVTRDEFLAARAAQFSKYDRNSNGYIDSHDVPKRLAERRQQNGGGDLLKDQFDSNDDGKVSKDEFVNGPTLAFDRADKDSNGVLDANELAAAKAAAKAAVDQWRSRKQQ